MFCRLRTRSAGLAPSRFADGAKPRTSARTSRTQQGGQDNAEACKPQASAAHRNRKRRKFIYIFRRLHHFCPALSLSTTGLRYQSSSAHRRTRLQCDNGRKDNTAAIVTNGCPMKRGADYTYMVAQVWMGWRA